MAQIECRLCFKSGQNHINLFDGSSYSLFIVSVINEHIGEVKHDDLLPNYVCHRCYKEIDTFHTFHRTVQSAQSNYLLQFVKNEFNDTEINIDENILVQELPSFVEVINEPKNENLESESIEEDDYVDESKEDPVSVNSEDDGDNDDGDDDVNHDDLNDNVESIEVNFDYTCDICGIDQGNFNQTISHYKKQHNADGYIKCCKYKYFNEASVNEHIEWHKNPELYQCKLCPYRGKTKGSFSTHNSRHKGFQTYVCDICNGTFRQKYGLTKHMMDFHINKTIRLQFKCKPCLLRFRSLEELEAHKKKCLEEEVTKEAKEQLATLKDVIPSLDAVHVDQIVCQHFNMSCDQCSLKFTSLIQIQYHYLNEHQNNNGHIKCCSGMTFQTQDQILDHVPYHIDKEICKCKICDKQMTTVSSIRNHLARHTQGEYQCNQCDKKFSKECGLILHINGTHGERLERVVMPTITDEHRANLTEYFDMKCSHSECESIIFTSLQHAKVHYLNVHNNPDGFIKCCGKICKTMYQVDEHLLYHTEPQHFMCKYCDKILFTKRTFHSHIYKHKKRESGFFNCEICHKVFGSKYDKRNHRKTHEPKIKRKKPEPKFQCSLCCRRFQTEDQKNSHEQRIHTDKSITNDEHFVCEFCAKIYHKKIELKSHIKRNHSLDQKKFPCEICNAVLSTKSSYQAHVKNHTSEVQKCPNCDKVSPNQYALAQHIKLKHLIQPIHKCNLCEKSFKVISSLKSHMATHTGEKLFKCSFCEESFIWRPNMYAHRKKMHPIEYAEYRKQNQKLP